jgi:peptidoglycan/LPS O-acetylase OafA/YrhL
LNAPNAAHDRIDILDGWRALSILCVLAGHLLPLGPGGWGLNGAVAATGMVVFFNLSGFLIARMLLADPHVPAFLIRRLFRIVPLAWLAVVVLTVATMPGLDVVAANLAFVANVPPTRLMTAGEHLWSLCVEAQFYAGVALIVALGGRRALYLLPAIGVAVTIGRVVEGVPLSIYTWQRVDEILAGSTVALLYHHGQLTRWVPHRIALFAVLLLPLVVASGHPAGGALNYLRPWLSAGMVAMTLVAAPALIDRLFRSRPAVYVATTSYALYVVHGMLMESWLGSGETFEKYLKRPLLIALIFVLAHASTFWFEARMIATGKRLARKVRGPMRGQTAEGAAS